MTFQICNHTAIMLVARVGAVIIVKWDCYSRGKPANKTISLLIKKIVLSFIVPFSHCSLPHICVENLLIYLLRIRKMAFTQNEHPGLLFLSQESLRD